MLINFAEMIKKKKMWSEIKPPVPGKNKNSHITCDIHVSLNDFNYPFANICNKMNSNFQTLNDHLFWKGPKGIHTFHTILWKKL